MKRFLVSVVALTCLSVSPVAFPHCKKNCPPPNPPPIVTPIPSPTPIVNVSQANDDNHRTRDILLGVALGAVGAYLAINWGGGKPAETEFGLRIKPTEGGR